MISQLGRAISEARNRTGGAEFHGSPAERRAEQERLDALSRTLAGVAGTHE